MSKEDALQLCKEYKVKADKYLNSSFENAAGYLRYLVAIIEQADTNADRCSYRSISRHWFRDNRGLAKKKFDLVLVSRSLKLIHKT